MFVYNEWIFNWNNNLKKCFNKHNFHAFSIVYGFVCNKNFKLKEIVNLLALCVFVSCFYVVLTKINSDFITTLNPYPIIFVMLIISVAVIKNFKFVVAFNLISFYLLVYAIYLLKKTYVLLILQV